MAKKKKPSTPIYLRPAKKPLTDAQRLERLEALVIDLMDALERVHSEGCDHEKWARLVDGYEPLLAALLAAAVSSKIRRDKGKCFFCGGDAHKCYWRHAEGKSCA